MKILGWLLVMLMIAACATVLADPSRIRLQTPTLLVRNNGIDALRFGMVGLPGNIGTALPGLSSCFKLHSLPRPPHQLLVHPLASQGWIYGPEIDLTTNDGWMITLGQSPNIEVFSLQPAPRCSK